MEIISDINLIRIVLALVMLAIGGVFDIWKREVHDYLWVVFGGIGLVVLLIEPEPVDAIYSILFALIIAPVSIIIWRIGLFGGADAFALIALALIAPQITLIESEITPLTTLSNAAILIIIPLIINVLRNISSIIKHENIFEGFTETKYRKILACIYGYRAKQPKYGFSIERKRGKSKKFSFKVHHAENDNFSTKPNTWITPGIPYLLLIIAGFVIQLLFGDLIMNGLSVITNLA